MQADGFLEIGEREVMAAQGRMGHAARLQRVGTDPD